MGSVEQAERAVMDELRRSSPQDVFPKTVIDKLQRQADLTDVIVAEAIWRLVAKRQVRLTRDLQLSVEQALGRAEALPAR